MLDGALIGSLAPEGIDVGVDDTHDEAKDRTGERELFRIPGFDRSRPIAHSAMLEPQTD